MHFHWYEIIIFLLALLSLIKILRDRYKELYITDNRLSRLCLFINDNCRNENKDETCKNCHILKDAIKEKK